jgi:two-component system CheB/CheR fusion protein
MGHGVLLIAISGWTRESDKARARAAGFDAHLGKPVDYERLLELLGARPE